MEETIVDIDFKEKEEYIINMGPQHPSTHGVLRFETCLQGEKVKYLIPHCGYIHRGIEKMSEHLTYPQLLHLTDRMDYLSAHINNEAVSLCVEKAMGVEVSDRVKYIRTILAELSRIASHQLWWAAFGMDLGALTTFFYGLRDREKILDIFEESTGARLLQSFITPGGLMNKIGSVLGADTFSPATLEPHHPDLFWYGIHGVEVLFTVMGTGCETVSRVSTENTDIVIGKWRDGRIGTFRGNRTGKHDYGGTAYGTEGNITLGPYDGYEALVIKIGEFFKTKIIPVDPRETLEIYAFMEAADESKRSGGAYVGISETLKKAGYS